MTGRLLQFRASSRKCAMCRRALHFTDLEMYPLNHAREAVLDIFAEPTGSEADALSIQVAVDCSYTGLGSFSS